MDRWTPTSTPRTPRTPRTQQYVLGTRNSNDQSRRPPSQGRRPPSQGSIRAGIGGGNPWGSDGNARTGGSRNSCIRLPSTNRGPSTPWGNHQKRGLQSKRGIGGGGRVTPRSGVGREQLDLINTQQGNKGTETPWSTTRTRGEDSSSPNHQRVTTPRTPFAAPFGAVDLEELIDAHRPGGIASNRSGGGGSSRIGGAPTSIRPSFRGDAGPAAVGDAAAGAGGRGGTLPASRGGSAGHELRNRSSASSSHRQPQPHLTPDGRLLSERHPQSTSAHTQPLLLKPRDISDWTKGSARPRTTAGGKKVRFKLVTVHVLNGCGCTLSSFNICNQKKNLFFFFLLQLPRPCHATPSCISVWVWVLPHLHLPPPTHSITTAAPMMQYIYIYILYTPEY